MIFKKAPAIIQQHLTAAKISQSEVAKSIGLSPPYFCDIVSGKRKVSLNTAIRLQDKYHMDAWGLVASQLEEELLAAMNTLHTSAKPAT